MNPEMVRDWQLLRWFVQNAKQIEAERQRQRRVQEEVERQRVEEELLRQQAIEEEERQRELEQEEIRKMMREAGARFKHAEQKMIVDAVINDVEDNIQREKEERLSLGVLLYKMTQRQW